jgi:antitoxin component of MazEF toxin-antitoxin module
MPKQVIAIDNSASLPLSEEIMEALGLETGAKVSLEIVGHTLIVRSVEESQRSEEFAQTFQSILNRRKSAYEQLAEGPQA